MKRQRAGAIVEINQDHGHGASARRKFGKKFVARLIIRSAKGQQVAGLPDKSPNNSIGDGDNHNDKGFSTSFPYVASPKSGYDPTDHTAGGTPPPLP